MGGWRGRPGWEARVGGRRGRPAGPRDLLSPLVSSPFCSLLAGASVARLVTDRLNTSLSEGCKARAPW